MTRLIVSLLVVVTLSSVAYATPSASDVVVDIYRSCVSQFSVSCAKPKALAWISAAVNEDRIKLTNDLTIVRTSADDIAEVNQQRSADVAMIDRIDNFLATHALKIEVPELLRSEEARSFIPDSYMQGGLAQGITVPLADGNVAEGRGFVKKIMIPFVLGLKFKTAVLVPLTIALIALKTWKAVTLGLLSLVLAGAMVIFKLAKPKIVNYEVVHYPHHVLDHHHDHHDHHDHHLEHHLDHHLEHIAHPPGWEHHGWARQMDAQQMAYSGQL